MTNDTDQRHQLLAVARSQTLAPRILALIEENLKHDKRNLSHSESQVRFLIGTQLCAAECPWCDSIVSYYECIPPSAVETYKIGYGPEAHECVHCKKRIIYSVPFMGNWSWRKHDDDRNPARRR